MKDAMYLGVTFLRDRRFLRDLMTRGHLTMLPPYLVWWDVDDMSAKTVFKDML